MGTKKGTCGACFRSMAVTASGKITRHGWSEAGGTRRVGQYGNVMHTGPCFGAGWDPYEVSPDCTKAFVDEVLFPMGMGIQEEQARLLTRPAMFHHGREWIQNEYRGIPRSEWNGYANWVVRVTDGDPGGYLVKWSPYTKELYRDTSARFPSYETMLQSATDKASHRWDAVSRDGLFCLDKIETWAPVELATHEKKLPLVHAPHEKGARWTRCGRVTRTWGGVQLRLTDGTSEVTCPKCKAA